MKNVYTLTHGYSLMHLKVLNVVVEVCCKKAISDFKGFHSENKNIDFSK